MLYTFLSIKQNFSITPEFNVREIPSVHKYRLQPSLSHLDQHLHLRFLYLLFCLGQLILSFLFIKEGYKNNVIKLGRVHRKQHSALRFVSQETQEERLIIFPHLFRWHFLLDLQIRFGLRINMIPRVNIRVGNSIYMN